MMDYVGNLQAKSLDYSFVLRMVIFYDFFLKNTSSLRKANEDVLFPIFNLTNTLAQII